MGQYLKKAAIGIVLASALVLPVHAGSMKEQLKGFYELEVIGDFGGQSAKPFLPSGSDFKEQLQKLKDERRGKRFLVSNLPVSSPSLTVGRVGPQEAAGIRYDMLSRPMFIIGYDTVSINWLKQNRRFLKEKRAIGLVVNVATVEEMNHLQSVAGEGVLLQATNGEQMAKAIKLRHYPFFVDKNGVMR
ncbi:integrating conjugative element protein [Marinobacter adhaerens]|jgi:integrating conjugative element protein (TIGR03765 family)|uniref:PFL_4695 family integrating conjugative element protein n=1 Tax=Marinobacter adhaerens TaxID=1033846 RepID=UPI000840E048|nr:integrating conjugative element protein [Marinobacter adhaerens]MCP4063883.1 integrating conjugative element protein [Gammaproteobacteria bacterium]ODM31402.1 integrating conjugative element protein [Marinobacter adhaerens]